MSYEIRYSQIAKYDLRDLYEYIKIESFSCDIAEEQMERIISSVLKLDEFPHRFRIYERSPWKQKGLRVMLVGNYIVLYAIDDSESVVNIIRVVHSRRNIDRILKETEY